MADVRRALDLARRALLFELRLYPSLGRWLLHRPAVPPSAEPFGYAQAVTPVMSLWIFASAVEIPVAHALLPWDGVRTAVLVLGVWGLVWMLGMLAALRVHPHLLTDDALRVRNGFSVDLRLPWEAVESFVVQRRDLPSSMRWLQPRETDDGTDLQIGVSGEVNVRAVLREPLTVPTSRGDLEVVSVSFLADDPKALVARAREHLVAVGRR